LSTGRSTGWTATAVDPSALLSHTPGSVAQCSASTRGRCSAATRAQLNSDQPPGRPAYRQSGT